MKISQYHKIWENKGFGISDASSKGEIKLNRIPLIPSIK